MSGAAVTVGAMPRAAALQPRPRTAAPVPPSRDIVEARQAAHIVGLDIAYHEGYTVMREAAGQQLDAPNLLADSIPTYLGARRTMLLDKLQEQHEHAEAFGGRYAPANRFALGTPGAGELMSSTAACVPIAPTPLQAASAAGTAQPAATYAAWRRELLAYRFEGRRAALEDEMCRRFAAEAMEQALAAEAAEREQAARSAGALLKEPRVWIPARTFDSVLAREDELLLALNLHPTAGSSGAVRQRPGAEATLWAAAAAANGQSTSLTDSPIPGGWEITAIAFCPRNPDTFAVGTAAGFVYLVSAAGGVKWATLTGHTDAITGLDWRTGGREPLLLTCSADVSARVWRVAFPSVVFPPAPPPPPAAAGAASAGDNTGGATAAGETAALTPTLPQQTPRRRGRVPRSSPPPQQEQAARGAGSGPPSRGFVPLAEGAVEARPSSTADVAAMPTPGRAPPLYVTDPSERAAALEAARRAMLADAAAAAARAAAAAGPTVEGGAATCVRVVRFDAPITHAAWLPANPALFVAAVVEEADVEVEVAVAEMEAAESSGALRRGVSAASAGDDDDGGDDAGAPPTSGDDDASGAAGSGARFGAGDVGAMLRRAGDDVRRGVVGGIGAVARGMKVVGRGIDAVPGVGGAARVTAALAKAAVTGDFVNPLTASGSGPRRERRGELFVVNAGTGRVVQSRTVRGKRLGPHLQRLHSYVTALAFSTSGHQLFVGDGMGRIHAFDIETDEVEQQVRPLKTHELIFGDIGAGGLKSAAGDEDGAAPVHLTTLFYRPYDSALRSPLLLGLDSRARVRALTVPPPTTATEQHWPQQELLNAQRHARGVGSLGGAGAAADRAKIATAAKAGARYAVEAVNAVTQATVAAVTLGQVSGDRLAVNIAALTPQAIEVPDYVAYAGGGAGSAVGGSMLPCRLHDGLLIGGGGGSGSSGDVFIVNPHGSGDALPGSLSIGGLARGGRDSAVGSGIVPSQVIARLTGAHAAPVTLIAMCRDESVLVTGDAAGSLTAWRMAPLSSAGDASPHEGSGVGGGGLEPPPTPGGGAVGRTSGRAATRLAALLNDYGGTVHSIGRAAAEEARALALGGLGGGQRGAVGGGAAGRSRTLPPTPSAPRARADSKRALPSGWGAVNTAK